MNEKIFIIQIIQIPLIIFISSVVYTYLYPWLYNKINNYTKRSEYLNDEIDFINVMIMITIFFLFVTMIPMFILSIFVGIQKLKK